MEKPYEILKTETAYQGRVFDVQRVEIRLADGVQKHLDVVSHNGAVTIVPIDQDGMIWFVRQYRHPAETYILELPAGTLEKDESWENCAQRETREEIGMAAGQLQNLGGFFLAPGYSTEYMVVFLATDLQPDPLEGDSDEYLSVVKIPISQAYQLAQQGQIKDSKSLAALFLARPHLVQNNG